MAEHFRVHGVSEVERETDSFVHFGGIVANSYTLCGWFDVETEGTKEPVDCPTCWEVVEAVKKIKERRK